MHTNLYLLVIIGVLDGFFMRPFHQFIMSKGISLIKYVNYRSQAIIILISSMLGGMAVTLSTIYLSLMLPGFIPLDKERLAYFIVSFLVGGGCWVLYARHYNKACPIDLDAQLKKWH